MNKKFLEQMYLLASATVFFLVAIFHLLRLIFQWKIIVGTFEVPFLLSYTGFPAGIAAAILGVWLVRSSFRK